VTKISLRILRGSLAGLFACATLLAAQSTSSPNDATSPAPILLWPNGAPGAAGDTPLDKPTLTPICPRKIPRTRPSWSAPAAGMPCLPSIKKELRLPIG
jgi:hypothetical protein